MTTRELLRCHDCGERLAFEALSPSDYVICVHCRAEGAHWVFPAYYRAEVEGQTAATREESQASCFFHPEKAASLACDGCGRFLCTVCDIHIGQNHLCTSCLQAGKNPLAVAKLDNEQVLHDNITLSIALVAPFAFWPIVPFTAPYALYRAIRYFNAPSSIVERTHWRLIVAMVLATAQIVGMIVLVFIFVKAIS